jgi:hypothetical protein
MNFIEFFLKYLKLFDFIIARVATIESLSKFRTEFEPRVEILKLQIQRKLLKNWHVRVEFHEIRVCKREPVHLTVLEAKSGYFLFLMHCLPSLIIFVSELHAVIIELVRDAMFLQGGK